MWLCTKYGFFSIVQKGADEYHIRARKFDDLVNLCDAMFSTYSMAETKARPDLHAELLSRIVESWDADYRYRFICGYETIETVIFFALAGSIDYSNFKGMIHGNDQADKSALYSRFWSDMLRYQDSQEGVKTGKK